MINIIKYIGLLVALFVYSFSAVAESLYATNLQSRLIDSDGDGVIDARDLCPNTPKGAAVDNNGCSVESTTLLSVELNILFATGRADIQPRFYRELKDLADFLSSNPNSSVVIEGHTDSQGSAELNRSLSERRAAAITSVLIESFGISPDRVQSVGYGQTRPIASNDTPEGRSKNRRVVVEVFSKQQHATERWTIYSVDENVNNSTSSNS